MGSVADCGAVGKVRDQKWWGREERAEVLATVRQLRASGASERGAADRVGVPRSTLQDWAAWGEHVDAHADVTAFFESPLGLAVLHRVVVAAHVVFVELGACGIRTVCKFLQLTGLSRFVASSFESQRRVNVAVERATIDYADAERQRLAAAMPGRKITVAQDETFTGGLCLVAIEPVSDYILLEKRAEARDAATWDKMMKEAMAGLKVEVSQSTSDEGKGVVAYAEKLLGVHHSPDLFHVQQELSRAVAPAAAAKLRAGERAVDEAEKDLVAIRLEAKRYLDELASRGPGRPPGWERRIRDAEATLAAARAEVTRLAEVRDELRGAVRALGAAYHVVDLETGTRLGGSVVRDKLQGAIDKIRAYAEQEELRESALARIDKAERVLPKMEATIAFVSAEVRRAVDELKLSFAAASAVHTKVIPAAYLERIAAKLPKAEAKPLIEKASALRDGIFEGGGPLSGLAAPARDEILQAAQRLAHLFQRSSSCVEGRNGVLSFRHHELHRIGERKRQVLTAMHNFFSERADRTTAAERFFGAKPNSLFAAVLGVVGVPTRPRVAKKAHAMEQPT